MKPLVLYKIDESPPSRAVMMVGHILGVPFEFIEPNMQQGEHLHADFIDKNPMHTIPLLNDRDFYVADSHVISTYLITKYGGKNSTIYPNNIQERATVDSRLHFDTGVLFQLIKACVPTIHRGESLSQEQIANVEDAYKIIDTYLNNTKYLATDNLTVADICAGATITTLNIVIPIDGERFPRVIQWIGELYKESCFQEINARGIEKVTAIFNSTMQQSNKEGIQALGR